MRKIVTYHQMVRLPFGEVFRWSELPFSPLRFGREAITLNNHKRTCLYLQTQIIPIIKDTAYNKVATYIQSLHIL